ncbi:hypothetical protein DERF_006172 [Dermatophagoides farinae]|uniref:Uncharacterized protein n=1 Tax=Dermatophagoides farinae TaxID=6954 RepID=A0A922I8E3_DERFA|nr:hypothetical protein DERF_006172 [Dermatophagoides farinae]
MPKLFDLNPSILVHNNINFETKSTPTLNSSIVQNDFGYCCCQIGGENRQSPRNGILFGKR